MRAADTGTGRGRGRVGPLLAALGLMLLPVAPHQTAGQGGPAREGKAARPAVKENVARVQKLFAADHEHLEKLYKQLHANPELSLQEARTSARLARELRDAGFTVTTKVGGYGVVGVFKNGKGPTVLVRTDMDALPVEEKTGLPYASTVRARDRQGREVPVMHACGHDMHMTCWVGTARVLVALKDRWKGTLVFIGQPAEEIGQGAKRMLADGLYKSFPHPDYCLALHCDSERPHGTVSYREGPTLANVDSVDVLVRGKGGHGAAPHMTVDPVVLAARVVLDLQTLVSRETDPADPAVVTVGSIHGGTKHNIIPDEVRLQLTVRSTNDRVRKHLLDGIQRIAEADAKGANAPPPVVKVDPAEYTPALRNDVHLARKLVPLFKEVLGEENVVERPQVMGGEDFSRYARSGTPILMYFLGTVPPERVAEAARPGGKPLPSLHSAQYYPVIEPTLKTGVLTMSMAVLKLLGDGPGK
jgi:amidohydrolase